MFCIFLESFIFGIFRESLIFYIFFLDNVGMLEGGPLQAANLRVPGSHVRGLQHNLTATVHGVNILVRVMQK